MVTIKAHHARGPEKTLFDMPPVVSAGPASGRTPARLLPAGLPNRAPAKNTSQLAELYLSTQRPLEVEANSSAAEALERDLDMAVALFATGKSKVQRRSAGDGCATATASAAQIERARRELNRMAERIGKEQETKHAEPGATKRDSGDERASE